MTAVRLYYLFCDGKGCTLNEEANSGEGSHGYIPNCTLADYRQMLALINGWRRSGKSDLCPDCVAAGRLPENGAGGQ